MTYAFNLKENGRIYGGLRVQSFQGPQEMPAAQRLEGIRPR